MKRSPEKPSGYEQFTQILMDTREGGRLWALDKTGRVWMLIDADTPEGYWQRVSNMRQRYDD